MNIALFDPAGSFAPTPGGQVHAPERIGSASEWIDPEGDDWFAAIYRELAQESASGTTGQPEPDIDRWFG